MPRSSLCPAYPFKDPNTSHLFTDELTGDTIIVAPARRYRPQGLGQKRLKDPFSPAGLKEQTILATYGSKDRQVTVVENRYPIFHQTKPIEGRQEILVEGQTRTPFTAFSVARITASIDAMAERCRIYRQDPRLKFMVVFKNEGKAAGASQPHPHSQIFGLPFVPERLKRMARARTRIRMKHHQTAHALALAEATPARTIYADRLVVAFADPVSRFAYGVRILTRRRIDNVTEATAAERRSFARALHALFPLVRERGYPYNLYFHDVFGQKDEFFEIHFVPRANVWGGFELDAGIVVNAVPAECAAHEYTLAKKKRTS